MACSTVLAAGNPGNPMVLISKVKGLLPADGDHTNGELAGSGYVGVVGRFEKRSGGGPPP